MTAADPYLPAWLAFDGATGVDPVGTALGGADARTRDGLFDVLAAALALPGHFGRNWDALADCLTDLVSTAPLTIVLDDADHLLIDEPPAQLRTLLAVLHGVAARCPGRLTVLLRCAPAEEPALRRRVEAALPPAAAGG